MVYLKSQLFGFYCYSLSKCEELWLLTTVLLILGQILRLWVLGGWQGGCSVAVPLSCGVHLSALPWMCMQRTLPSRGLNAPPLLSAARVWHWFPCECAFALSLPSYCQDHSLLHLPKGLNIGDSFWTCLLFLLPKLEQFYTLFSVYTCEYSSLLWRASKKEIVLFFPWPFIYSSPSQDLLNGIFSGVLACASLFNSSSYAHGTC